MKNNNKSFKFGFTLVELSIVLVIIGLLIGGILVGQSLIESARISKFVSTIQQFDVAAANFKTKYKNLPGDTMAFGCTNNLNPVHSQCGNGKIENQYGNTENFAGEIANFWPSIQKGGFTYKGKTFTTAIPTSGFDTESSTPNAPSVYLDSPVTILAMQCGTISPSGNCWQLIDTVGWHVGGFNSANYLWLRDGASGNHALMPITAQSVDGKMDDGKPATGLTRVYLGIAGAQNSGCYSGGSYLIADKTKKCFLEISMFNN